MILGAIAGDVIGSRFEWRNVKTTEFPLFETRSTFTDDSVMTLAVAESLIVSSMNLQPLSLAFMMSMRQLGREYPDAGYGGRFSHWLKDPISFPRPYNSWGNGSAMRVSPVAWAFDSLELVEFVAAESAKITHNHPEGIRGAQAIAGCTFLTRKGASKDEIRSYCERLGYVLDFTLDDIRDDYEFDVSCQGSVPQAIEAFLESDGFENAIRLAISIGGDSDTIGAMTASIAQAAYGVPEEIEAWVRSCLDARLLQVNDRFCDAYMAGSSPTQA